MRYTDSNKKNILLFKKKARFVVPSDLRLGDVLIKFNNTWNWQVHSGMAIIYRDPKLIILLTVHEWRERESIRQRTR